MNKIKKKQQNNKYDDKPRRCVGKDFLEVHPAIDKYTFQRHADQRTSEESGRLINRILISELLVV